MKKVGIVTFHRSTSYGACLQTFATYKYLSNLQFDAEVIDYTNIEEQKFRRWTYKENGKFSGYITSLIKNIVFKKKIYADIIYGKPEKYYKLTQKRYKNKNELQDLNYDVLIAGSDQIWSPSITGGVDDVYLLQFGKSDKRISIASSLGSAILSEAQHEFFEKSFKSFSSISVREPFAKKQLVSDTDKKIDILMDPTFLLRKEEWIEYLASKSVYRSISDNYILTFFVAPQNDYREKVQEYADALGLPIWSIQPTKIKRVNSSKVIVGVKIEDFLALIKNASLVITDSFHGVAISVNLFTDFIVFNNVSNPVRVETLLEKLSISDRIEMKINNYKPINYKIVSNKLEILRQESQKWIKRALE